MSFTTSEAILCVCVCVCVCVCERERERERERETNLLLQMSLVFTVLFMICYIFWGISNVKKWIIIKLSALFNEYNILMLCVKYFVIYVCIFLWSYDLFCVLLLLWLKFGTLECIMCVCLHPWQDLKREYPCRVSTWEYFCCTRHAFWWAVEMALHIWMLRLNH